MKTVQNPEFAIAVMIIIIIIMHLGTAQPES
jgi:hypothetical protein